MTSILIVEDDLSLQRLYKMILEASGYEIIATANNGEEAIQIYKQFNHKPEIILMDHRMPIKNGIEATKEILKISGHSKIIFASADNSIREIAISVGAISFLEKPFELKALIEEIKRVLG